MALTPTLGRSGSDALERLEMAQRELGNAQGAGGPPDQQMTRYINWATSQSAVLQQFVSRTDVERLILTRSFYSLLDNSTGSSPRGYPLLDGEIRTRLADLDREIEDLRALIGRWRTGPKLTVLDTNVFIHAESQFDSLDLSNHLGSDSWHLMILMVNVDELDRLKRSGNAKSDQGESVRTRSRVTLRLIEQVVTQPDTVVPLTGSESVLEVVTDPRGHERLPINDDEIVARAATIQAVAGRPVHLITTDTGMLMRARAAQLGVHRLSARSLETPSNI